MVSSDDAVPAIAFWRMSSDKKWLVVPEAWGDAAWGGVVHALGLRPRVPLGPLGLRCTRAWDTLDQQEPILLRQASGEGGNNTLFLTADG